MGLGEVVGVGLSPTAGGDDVCGMMYEGQREVGVVVIYASSYRSPFTSSQGSNKLSKPTHLQF